MEWQKRRHFRCGLVLLTAIVLGLVARAAAQSDPTGPRVPLPASFKHYTLDYYNMYSDLDQAGNQEAAIHMKAMAEEYWKRTKSFGGKIRRKLPFYLCSTREDYTKLCGAPGSAGLYRYIPGSSKGTLYACMGRTGHDPWHVVQHEGWHQFVHMAIGGGISIWVNEGLAEYFGSAQWTGDKLMTGLVISGYYRDVQAMIRDKKIKSIRQVIAPGNDSWWKSNIPSYRQAWSMCHYLVHSDKKNQSAFGQYIHAIAKGSKWDVAFIKAFGKDLEGFEKNYHDWWLALKTEPLAAAWAEVNLSTLTSFLARAHTLGMRFDNFEDFFAQAGEGKIIADIKTKLDFWLPPALLEQTVQQAQKYPVWKLEYAKNKRPQLTVTLVDGTILTSSYTPKGKGNFDVTIKTAKGDPPPPTDADRKNKDGQKKTKPKPSAPEAVE
jgi:hypothetical protein